MSLAAARAARDDAPPVATRGALQSRLADRLGSQAEARWMVEEVLGRPLPRSGPVSPAVVARLEEMADRRLAGEPLQYVLGTWAFRTLELTVDRRALIPRPETEQVAGIAMAELRRVASRPGPAALVDLGTGTGAIALAVAAELGRSMPELEIWATDADPVALSLAAANRDRVSAVAPWVSDRVHLRAGSWYGALPADLAGRVDVVVANPPYVSPDEWDGLDREVRAEPRRALVSADGRDGTPGMAEIEAVVSGALAWLGLQGAVVVELAPHQADAAARLGRRLGYQEVRVLRDLTGRERALVAAR